MKRTSLIGCFCIGDVMTSHNVTFIQTDRNRSMLKRDDHAQTKLAMCQSWHDRCQLMPRISQMQRSVVVMKQTCKEPQNFGWSIEISLTNDENDQMSLFPPHPEASFSILC